MRALVAIALVAACGGGKKPDPAAPRAEDEAAPPAAADPEADPRVVHLRTMTEALALLAADV